MSQKDVKTKPKTSPKTISKETVKKVAVKGKESLKENVKDVKTLMRDAAIRKIADAKDTEKGETQKAETEATENVESGVYLATDAVYRKSKQYVQKKVKEHKAKTKENASKKDIDEPSPQQTESETENPPKKRENEPKTRENYNRQNEEPAVKEKSNEELKKKSEKKASVKTKEEYLKAKSSNKVTEQKEASTKTARKTYVEKKLKTRAEYEKAYAEEYRRTNLQRQTIKTKNNTELINRKNTISANAKRKAGKGTKNIVKQGSSYTGKYAKKKATKATKTAVKTQKEVAKKTAKEAAKQAKILAQKMAIIAKKVAIVAGKVAVKIAQLVAQAVAKLISAIVAAGGWAVLVVVLIVIIIIAAIAASPFGIFISDEAADAESIPVSSIVNECNIELSSELEAIEDANPHDRVELEGEPADWNLVLSLFSVKVAGKNDNTVEDVVVIDEAKKQKLKDVFWDMHEISSRTETVTSGETSETVLYITITTKTKDEMIDEYGFSNKQKEALETLLENASGFLGSTQSLAISDATAQEALDTLSDSLSDGRKKVVKHACSLVGKVTYFWGGKSSAIGWDSNWGKMKRVTAEGSRSTGTIRPFGLDCSGFVTWAFINAGYTVSQIGHGAATQASKGTRISWASVKPGDLALYSDNSHIGIIAGKDSSGNVLVIHCASGANNVVITGKSGFGYVVRVNFY